MPTYPPCTRPTRAFTITEMLIVVGVIALLLAILLAALGGVRTQGLMGQSMSALRQIGQAMTAYSGDHRDLVLPSQFNHEGDTFPGHSRCGSSFPAEWHARGTWADILWTENRMGAFPEAGVVFNGNTYWNDSPDSALYELVGDVENPLRSSVVNSRDVPDGTGPTPYGTGARERGLPGYFAANNFFNDDEVSSTYNDAGPFSTGQIRAPSRSMYLVDSVAGEVIEDDPEPFDNTPGATTLQVDFRYTDTCLLLFLDGHTDTQTPWLDLDELEDHREVRVRDLTDR